MGHGLQVEGEVEGGDGNFLHFLPWFDPGFFGDADGLDAGTGDDEVVARLWGRLLACALKVGGKPSSPKEKRKGRGQVGVSTQGSSSPEVNKHLIPRPEYGASAKEAKEPSSTYLSNMKPRDNHLV